MVRIELALLPSLLKEKDSKLCIVLDVLRATSTITTLVSNRSKAVIPVCDTDQAISLRDLLTRNTSYKLLLCGEDNIGQLNKSFDLYNSPSKLSQDSYEDSIIIMKSTSGTKLLSSLGMAQEIIVASALNIDACATYAIKSAKKYNSDISVICSGSHENAQITLEDTACAGMLINRIQEETNVLLNDSAKLAAGYWRNECDHVGLMEVFKKSDTGERLENAGEGQDVEYCSQINITNVVPIKIPPLEGINQDVLMIGDGKV